MENYRITIDSNSDLPSFLAEKYQTVIIPQYYAFGDEVYGDEKNMTPAEFYQKMRLFWRNTENISTSSSPWTICFT